MSALGRNISHRLKFHIQLDKTSKLILGGGPEMYIKLT